MQNKLNVPAKVQEADTLATGKVAPTVQPETKIRSFPAQLDLTEPQGYMIEAFDLWTKAQTDPVFRDHLHAWENLRYSVDSYLRGEYTYDDSVQGYGKEKAGEHFAAVVSIGKLFPLFASGVEQDAPELRAKTRIVEGGTENGNA